MTSSKKDYLPFQVKINVEYIEKFKFFNLFVPQRKYLQSMNKFDYQMSIQEFLRLLSSSVIYDFKFIEKMKKINKIESLNKEALYIFYGTLLSMLNHGVEEKKIEELKNLFKQYIKKFSEKDQLNPGFEKEFYNYLLYENRENERFISFLYFRLSSYLEGKQKNGKEIQEFCENYFILPDDFIFFKLINQYLQDNDEKKKKEIFKKIKNFF